MIELASTNEIWEFKEFDRFIEPKNQGDDPIKEIENKCNSISIYGFFEPLVLKFDKKPTKLL